MVVYVFFFQTEGGIRGLVRSRGLGDWYKRQGGRLTGGGSFSGRSLGHGTAAAAALGDALAKQDMQTNKSVVILQTARAAIIKLREQSPQPLAAGAAGGESAALQAARETIADLRRQVSQAQAEAKGAAAAAAACSRSPCNTPRKGCPRPNRP